MLQEKRDEKKNCSVLRLITNMKQNVDCCRSEGRSKPTKVKKTVCLKILDNMKRVARFRGNLFLKQTNIQQLRDNSPLCFRFFKNLSLSLLVSLSVCICLPIS